MFKLYKNGDYAVNNATFDYVCDSVEDLMSIPKNRSTLGSTAIVIDKEEGIRVFVCDSNDNWVEVESNSGSSTGDSGSGTSYVLTKDKITKALGVDVVAEINKLAKKDDAIETKISEINEKIASEVEKLNGKNNEQDTKITAIEEKNTAQDEEITAIEEKNDEQDEKIVAVEEKNAEQDEKITAVEEKNAAQDEQLTSIEEKNAAQDEQLTAIETKNSEQDEKITAIEEKDAEQDEKFEAVNEKFAEQDEKFDDIDTKFSEQDEKLEAIDEKDSEQDERLEKLEKRPVVPVNTNNYELLNEIVCDGTYNVITLSQTDEGEDYNLTAVYAEFAVTKPTATADIRIFANDILTSSVTNGIPSTSSNTKPFKSASKINIEGGMLIGIATSIYQSPANINVQAYGALLKGGDVDTITKIDIASSTATVFPANSVIRIYGIKE